MPFSSFSVYRILKVSPNPTRLIFNSDDYGLLVRDYEVHFKIVTTSTNQTNTFAAHLAKILTEQHLRPVCHTKSVEAPYG